jgi:hypothetical protein
MHRVLTATGLILATSGCFVADSGDLHASWSITQGAVAGTCAAIGGDTVEIFATRRTGDRIYQELFDCVDRAATITDVRPGPYDVEVTLYDAFGNALSQPFSIPVTVRSDEVVELGNFEFNFPPARPTEATSRT